MRLIIPAIVMLLLSGCRSEMPQVTKAREQSEARIAKARQESVLRVKLQQVADDEAKAMAEIRQYEAKQLARAGKTQQ